MMSSKGNSGEKSTKDKRNLFAPQNVDNVAFPEEMKENLQKLKTLSRDELTENAMLRSRIDQQAELICILKQRADEALRKTRVLETELAELKTSREDILELFQNETTKYSVLEKRFTVLNSNHEEMIILKDEYKEQNKKLLKENNLLRKENREVFNKAMREQDEEIRKLKQQVECLNERLTSSNRDQRLSREKVTALEEKASDEKRNLLQQVTQLQEQVKAHKEDFETVKDKLSENEARLTHSQNEKEEFAGLAIKRGTTIKEQQQVIEELRKRVEEAENEIKEMENHFSREVENLSANVQVRKAKQLLEEEQKRHQATVKEYDAYKRHMETLLAREKELNNRLRVLIG